MSTTTITAAPNLLLSDMNALQQEIPGKDSKENKGESSFRLDEFDAYDKRKPSKLNNTLNLLSNAIYFMNFFIIIPSVNKYLKALGYDESLSGILVALGPLCGAMMTMVYTRIVDRSIKFVLLCAALTGLLGNLMYALALTADSVWLLIVGRLVCGFATCTCATRYFLTKYYGSKVITAANAELTTATALGAAVAPLIAAGLSFVNIRIGKVYINSETDPGWFMTIVYAFLLFGVGAFFEDAPVVKEPEALPLKTAVRQGSGAVSDDEAESQPEKEPEKKKSPVAFFVTIAVLFLTKFAMGSLETSAPLIADANWSMGIFEVSLILAGANFCVLPVNFTIRKLSKKYSDRYLIGFLSPTQTAVFLLILSYNITLSVPRYIVGLCTFVIINQSLESVAGGLFYKSVPRYMLIGPFTSNASYTAVVMAIGRALGAVWGAGMILPSNMYSLNAVVYLNIGLFIISTISVYFFYKKLSPFKRD